MPERVILTIGTKKGLFVAQAPKSRCSFALNGPVGPGVAVYATLIDTRGTPRLYASSCNPFFGMKVLRSTDLGKKFKETKSAPAFAKDDGAHSPTSGRSKRGMTRRISCAAWSQHRSSGRATAEIPGSWLRASATMSTLESGSPATEDCACTRSSATGIAFTSASPRAATT